MKKLILAALFLVFLAGQSFGAGLVTQSQVVFGANEMRAITLKCLGDSSDGSIPDTTISYFPGGMFLDRIIIENFSSDTDTASDVDVYIKDTGGTDLLNAEGVDELDYDTRNYVVITAKSPVVTPLTLDVDSQTAASALYTITLILTKYPR